MIGMIDQVKEYNERVKSHGLAGVEPMITGDSLRTYIKNNLKPDKKELIKDKNRKQ